MGPSSVAVHIRSGAVWLDADLFDPLPGRGTVIFAHGSGSGRHSPRNRQVAAFLHRRGLGTLLLDLLTPPEARVDEVTAEHRFDIPLLTERLLAATDWFRTRPNAVVSTLGYFGASTGGAVAMIAATRRSEAVGAIVLRGARTDLGDSGAAEIRCPTLMLAGEKDDFIRGVNTRTLGILQCPKQLVVVPGASHLFEERGALEQVAESAGGWFDRHLSRSES